MENDKKWIAKTPAPPYYAVILTVVPGEDTSGYDEMISRMVELAKSQEGFLGIESAESEIGVIVSYWEKISNIEAWSKNAFHQTAKSLGKQNWYKSFRTRICRVEQEY